MLCLLPQHKQKRDLIINEKSPENQDPSFMKSIKDSFWSEFTTLNEEQEKAVLRSIATTSFHMILGTPGSGKTHAIVAMIRILASLKKKVLLVSFTNNAVDNVLIRLKRSGFTQFVRLTHNENLVDSEIQSNIINSRKLKTMK